MDNKELLTATLLEVMDKAYDRAMDDAIKILKFKVEASTEELVKLLENMKSKK